MSKLFTGLTQNLAIFRATSRDEQFLLSDGGVAIATPKEETGIDYSDSWPGVVGILRKSSLGMRCFQGVHHNLNVRGITEQIGLSHFFVCSRDKLFEAKTV